MKRYFILFLALLPFTLFAQNIEFNVEGIIKNADNETYAYLVNSGGQELFMMTPVVNGVFKFHGTADLDGEYLKYVYLFLNKQKNISIEEVKSKLKQRIWQLGDQTPFLRSIVLEDIKLDIESVDKVYTSNVCEKGFFTKQSKEFREAITEKKILEFIKKYPDSPISLYGIVHIIRMYELPAKSKVEGMWGYPRDMYSFLSERLKNSKPGMVLKKQIEEIYNP